MFQALGVTFARNVTNKSYLSGVQMWTDAMSEPERFVPKLLRNYTSSALPMVVSLVSLNGTGDQEAREMRSIWEAMKNKTPGLRSTLDPKRNGIRRSCNRGESSAYRRDQSDGLQHQRTILF